MRSHHRPSDGLRPVTLTPQISRYAEGSCLVEFGHTKVLCAATVEASVPPFKRNTGTGWVTAEYGMLPRATGSRNPREAARGKQSGRTQEIQRLIGRALRAVVDFKQLGERQITVDCDVLEADGGTRTAAITGGYVALALACRHLVAAGIIRVFPLSDAVAAISCGIVEGEALLDLDYIEDSGAEVDGNFIFTGSGKLVEIQAAAEGRPFGDAQFMEMLRLAGKGTEELFALQKDALKCAVP